MNTGKCPHCKQIPQSVTVNDIDLSVGMSPKWKGFSYSCAFCNAILGVQMNPLTLNVDLVRDIKKGD